MKIRFNLIPTMVAIACLCLSAASQPLRAQQPSSAQALFNHAVQLYNQDRFEEALIQFQEVLKLSPNSLYARSYAGKCKAAMSRGGGAKNALREQLEKIQLPKLAFDEAPVGDVMDYLSQRAEELSGGKIALNFIYKGTSEQRKNTLVTLSLRNVPMTEVIRYIGQVTHIHFSYEEHAVIADPNSNRTTAQTKTPESGTTKDDGKIFGEDPPKSPFGR